MNLIAQRPRTWNSVVGQQRGIDVLQAVLKNSKFLTRGIILYGVLGVGKTTTAYLAAKALMCLGSDPLGCGECSSCTLIDESDIDQHPDFVEVDGAQKSGVDAAREIIEMTMSLPVLGRRKVTVIDEAQVLSSEAWTAYLKTLEQGNTDSVFIFVSNEVEKIKRTITSRCIKIPFERVNRSTMIGLLSKIATDNQIPYDLDGLDMIVRHAKGIIRDAVQWLNTAAALGEIKPDLVKTVIDTSLEDKCLKLLVTIAKKDQIAAVKLADEIGLNFLPQKIVEMLLSLYARSIWQDDPDSDIRQIYMGLPNVGELGESFGPTTTGEKPIDKQERVEQLEKLIPSQESEGKESRKRFGELAPVALAGPGGAGQALLRTGLAVSAGNVGEELGGETGRAIGELAGFIAPNPTRLLQSRNAVRQRLIEFGRDNGMTEEALTIATKPDNWYQRMLARSSIKRGPVRAQVEQTQRELGNIYNELRAAPEAQQTLQVGQMQNFIQNADLRLQALPANLRNEVMPDMLDFLNSRRTGADLINVYQDINDSVARIGGERGLRLAGMLDPITHAIADLSPALAVDFGLTNDLYTNFVRMRTALRPNLTDDILNGAKALGAVWSLATGDFVNLSRLATVSAARAGATALVLSPRLQNLQHKMLTAMNQNRYVAANEALELFKQGMKEDAPEYYDFIKDASFTSVAHNDVVDDKVTKSKK